MDKKIRIYDLHDEQQYLDEIAYWKDKTPQEKLHALEVIRKTAFKLNPSDGNQQRLQRVLRIVKQI